MSTLNHIARGTSTVVLDLEDVPAMDATGMVNLESALQRLERDRAFVILASVQPQPAKVMHDAGIDAEEGVLAFCDTLEHAVDLARNIRENALPPATTPLPG
jgi:sulfate permease, SulP family